MKTKIFYLLLLCLMVLGRGEVWADTTYEWSADGQKSTLSVTATNTENTGNAPSYYSNYSISYGGTDYATAVKIDSKGQIVFTTSGVSNITIGVALKDNCDYSSKNANITLNDTKSATVSTGTGSSTQTGLELTYNNQPAGTYTITKGDNEVGIFYIKVVQTSKSTPTLGFQYGDNAAAVIPANKSSTTVVNPLTTNPENAAVTWSITSAGTTGATVSNASGTEGYVTVSAAGTCVVRASTAETTTYAASYREYTLTVTKADASLSGPSSFVQTYPYTWDFTSSSSAWSTSRTQLTETYSDWSQVGDNTNYYTQNHNYGSGNYPIGYNIDVIKGLRFSQNWFGLDWSYGHIWFAGGSIVIPGLSAGQIVTFVMEGRDASESTSLTAPNTTGNFTILKSDGDHKTYRYSVTANGDVTFTFNHAVSIRSISVIDRLWTYTPDETTKITTSNNFVISGEKREFYTQATVTFNAEGTLLAGTEIVDMPGLKVTLGKPGSASTWFVNSSNNVTSSQEGSVVTREGTNWNPIDGCFVKFEPTVNGFISLEGVFDANDNGKAKGSFKESSTGNDIVNIRSYTTSIEDKMLIGGKTYYLYCLKAPLQLHSFTFRPAYLNPEETAEQSKTDPFPAYVGMANPAGYPKLVHGNVGVAFTGDIDKVEMETDGTFTFKGPGVTYIRGKAISGSNELCAYYKLSSNVLELVETIPEDGAVGVVSLDNNLYRFSFKDNIRLCESDTPRFIVYKDGEAQTGCAIAIESSKLLTVSGLDLEAGSTYTIQLLEGAVSKNEENSRIYNAKTTVSFTMNSDQPTLEWFYPLSTSAVRVGSSIVIKSSVTVDLNYPDGGIKGKIAYDGGSTPMEVSAAIDGDKIVFKPTSPLLPSTPYTLTIKADQVKQNAVNNIITKDKVFYFTTAAATGVAPTLVSSTPNNSTTSMTYTGGVIEFNWSENVEVEPYTTINVTPVNGSEATAHGTSAKLDNDKNLKEGALKVDTENPNRLYFPYSLDELKYDLYYRVVIPANTVTGPGGMPNESEIVINFRMQTNPAVANKTLTYPHTWDFSNLGETTLNGLDASKAYRASIDKTAVTGYVWEALDTSHPDEYKIYCNNNNKQLLEQGNEIGYTTSAEVTTRMNEMKGLRISMMTNRTNQLRIRKTGSGKYYLHLNGNTNYLTVPKLKANQKLYIRAQANGFFRINSVDQAKFTQGNTDVDGQVGNANGTSQTYIVELKDGVEEADVIFCIDNVSFYQMAVATQEKEVSSVGYATNARSYPVDYSLDETFLDRVVEAYIVTDVNSDAVTTKRVYKVPATTATTEGSNNGVLLKNSGVWPLFTLDVNSEAEEMIDDDRKPNLLKGVVQEGEINTHPGILPQKDEENNVYNYILANSGYNVKYQKDEEIGEVAGLINGLGFYLVMKDGTRFGNGQVYQATTGVNNYTAYLQLPDKLVVYKDLSGVSTARNFFMIDFGEETTDISVANASSLQGYANEDDAYYSLQGVKVKTPGKGLYIHKGKRVVVK